MIHPLPDNASPAWLKAVLDNNCIGIKSVAGKYQPKEYWEHEIRERLATMPDRSDELLNKHFKEKEVLVTERLEILERTIEAMNQNYTGVIAAMDKQQQHIIAQADKIIELNLKVASLMGSLEDLANNQRLIEPVKRDSTSDRIVAPVAAVVDGGKRVLKTEAKWVIRL